MLEQIPGEQRVTVGGDKGFETAADCVRECRHMKPGLRMGSWIRGSGCSGVPG